MVKSKSVYKGVGWSVRLGKWTARIADEGSTRFLGHFDKEEDARDAYIEFKEKRNSESLKKPKTDPTGLDLSSSKLTKREYACIHLRLPMSGNNELDELIDLSIALNKSYICGTK